MPGRRAPGPPASATARPHGGATAAARRAAPALGARPAGGGRRCRRRLPHPRARELVRRAAPARHRADSWASPLEQAKAAVAVETEAVVAAEHVVDDTAISDDDESIDDLTDVGVPVVERILGGTVIAEDPR